MKFTSDRQRKAIFANMFSSRGDNKFAINPVMIEGYTGSKIYTDPYGGGASGIVMDDVPVDVVKNTAILAGEGYKRSPTREDVIAARNRDLLAGMPVYSHADILEPIQKEYITGGYADGRPDSDFDPEQLAKGIEVEMEHVIKFTDKGSVRKPKDSDIAKAKEISKDHLAGDHPYYYNYLADAENKMKEDLIAETGNPHPKLVSGLKIED